MMGVSSPAMKGDATAAQEAAEAAAAASPWYELTSPWWSIGGVGAMGIAGFLLHLITKNTIAQIALVFEGKDPVVKITA